MCLKDKKYTINSLPTTPLLLLSVPLTMIVKIALEASDEGRWLATMLGTGEETVIISED